MATPMTNHESGLPPFAGMMLDPLATSRKLMTFAALTAWAATLTPTEWEELDEFVQGVLARRMPLGLQNGNGSSAGTAAKKGPFGRPVKD